MIGGNGEESASAHDNSWKSIKNGVYKRKECNYQVKITLCNLRHFLYTFSFFDGLCPD